MLAPWGWFSKDEKPVGAYNKLQESLSETVTQGMNLTTQAYKSTSDAMEKAGITAGYKEAKKQTQKSADLVKQAAMEKTFKTVLSIAKPKVKAELTPPYMPETVPCLGIPFREPWEKAVDAMLDKGEKEALVELMIGYEPEMILYKVRNLPESPPPHLPTCIAILP